MTPRGHRVPVSRLVPGTVAAGDVVDSEGRMLAPDGATLTPEVIELLRAAGVPQVRVRATSSLPPIDRAGLDPKVLARVEAEQRLRFGRCDLAAEPIRRLFEICVIRAARLERRAGGNGARSR